MTYNEKGSYVWESNMFPASSRSYTSAGPLAVSTMSYHTPASSHLSSWTSTTGSYGTRTTATQESTWTPRVTNNTSTRHTGQYGDHGRTTREPYKSEDTKEDNMTELRKTVDLMKEIQKIDLCKLEQNVGTLQKEDDKDKERRLREECEEAKKEVLELKSKLEEAESNIREIQTKNTLNANREVDDLRAKVKEMEEKYAKRLTKFEESTYDFTTKEEEWKKEKSELMQKLRQTQKELSTAEKEKSEAQNRLSKEMGRKLNDRNPNIADLSDPNRPTQLAERYNELYDNEWTDAIETLTENGMEEEAAIKVLLAIMESSYTFCKEISSAQVEGLQNLLMSPISKVRGAWSTQSSVPKSVSKLLNECQREMKLQNADALYKEFLVHSTNKHASKIPAYVKKCLELCWYMVIYDPPMVLAKCTEAGDPFDSNTYKHYTQTGTIVSYIVWFPLLLYENGPLLYKGVAQPISESSRTPRSRSAAGTPNYHDQGYTEGRPATSVNTYRHQTSSSTGFSDPKYRETDLDRMFESNTRQRNKYDDRQGQKYEHESKPRTVTVVSGRSDANHGQNNAYSSANHGQNSEYSYANLGFAAEGYRKLYGQGPTKLEFEGCVTPYVYYDGRIYTVPEWNLFLSRYTGSSQDSSHA